MFYNICAGKEEFEVIGRVDIASILDADELQAGLGEMRDDIKVDELSEGLLAAVLGQICPQGFGCSGPARWIILVQRHWAAHEW